MKEQKNCWDYKIMRDNQNKRIKKVWNKARLNAKTEKEHYFSNVIEEWGLNQTSNWPKDMKAFYNGRKFMRKKSAEELKLLEYFLEKDPNWERQTISSAAKVLWLSPYQVYKWGYDRKNKKDNRVYSNHFLKELEITNSMIEKINKFDNEISGKMEVDLNQKVEDLFVFTARYKNYSDISSEIPMEELSFIKNETKTCPSLSDPDFSFFDQKHTSTGHIFSVEKVNRKRRAEVIQEDYHSQKVANLITHYNIKSRTVWEKRMRAEKSEKHFEETHSDVTADKSVHTVGKKDASDSQMALTCENTPITR
jgi:hypothetical protein